jgi:hypothetical protein
MASDGHFWPLLCLLCIVNVAGKQQMMFAKRFAKFAYQDKQNIRNWQGRSDA